jgi:hypothetical protein
MTHTIIACALSLLFAQAQPNPPKQHKHSKSQGTFTGTVVQQNKTGERVLLLDADKERCPPAGEAAGVPYYADDCVHTVYQGSKGSPGGKVLSLGQFGDHITVKGHYCSSPANPNAPKEICDGVVTK